MPHQATPISIDAVIFGGGVAGLWTLDTLSRQGHTAILLESTALGHGQTVWSQGILHGGLKYTLSGLLTDSAKAIAEMPALWRNSLAGTPNPDQPDLSTADVRAHQCHLWRTKSLTSRLGMIGARTGLRVKPTPLDRPNWPTPLTNLKGEVFTLDEQVVRPTTLLSALAAPWQSRTLLYEPQSLSIHHHPDHTSLTITAPNPTANPAPSPEQLTLNTKAIILTAGLGNPDLAKLANIANLKTQRRPLHMLLAKGRNLPPLNGHCVDGAKTRVTITSDRDHQGNTIWQIGGQVSEDGVDWTPDKLIQQGKAELAASLGTSQQHLTDLGIESWSTYIADRAEVQTPSGARPADAYIHQHHNPGSTTLVAWPTKLVLAPVLAQRINHRLPNPTASNTVTPPADWPRPPIAQAPWEEPRNWLPQ